jgi:uncharacterized protein YndB with AHSA1/START domain
MRFEIDFERHYAHPPEKVWRALTDKEALGQWLMETDFEPVLGRAFKMWCADGEEGTDTYLCELRAYDPPRRMVWSWVLDGRQAQGETVVEYRLEPAEGGSRLAVTHSGDRDRETIERFKGGWPLKLADLEATLAD